MKTLEYDIIISPLPFGGAAFEPVSEAGRDWVTDLIQSNPDYPFFHAPDGCMTGFDAGSLGVEPYDVQDFIEDARAAGMSISI